MRGAKSRGLRGIVLLMTLALVATACGGAGSDDPTPTAAPTSTEPTADTTATEDDEEEVSQEELDLTLGGVPASSSVFAWFVALARVLPESDPNITINVRETNSGGENIGLVTEGAIDFGVGTPDQAASLPNLRMLLVYYQSADFFLVRRGSGIETLEDLEGQPFSYGLQGSGSALRVQAVFEALGIQPDVFEGSLEDIVNAMKDQRIVGFSKAANGLRADASMLDVASAVEVDLIGFSDENLEVLAEEMPNLAYTDVPAGALPGTEAHTTMIAPAIMFVDESMPDEVAYRLTKALWESLEPASDAANFEPTRGHTYEGTLAITNQVPLHPGAEQFYEDEGAL